MYQIIRNRITEDLQLKDGDRELIITVDISVDDTLRRYNVAARDLAVAQEALSKYRSKAPEHGEEFDRLLNELGNAVVKLFIVVFGEENTEQLCQFYDGRYITMLSEIAPFIADKVAPKMLEAQQAAQDKYAESSAKFRKIRMHSRPWRR